MAAGPTLQQGSSPQVRELHIDFLLEEEFSSSPAFLRAFIAKANPEHAEPSAEVISVKRSVGDAFGEADLLVVYQNPTGKKIAILIEDKLRAPFQHEQDDRYRIRGGAGISLSWDCYWTCLVAPQCYLERGHGFDAAISLENIIDLFSLMEERRGQFKSGVLREAIKKCGSSGVQVVDPEVTEFRSRHYAFFKQFFGNDDIRIRLPADTYRGDTWFTMRSLLLPKGAYIDHKSSMGVVDLTFPNTDVAVLRKLMPYLEPDMTPVQTSKSAAIRIKVPAILKFDDFERDKQTVTQSFLEVRRLLALYKQNREHFDAVLPPSNGREQMLAKLLTSPV